MLSLAGTWQGPPHPASGALPPRLQALSTLGLERQSGLGPEDVAALGRLTALRRLNLADVFRDREDVSLLGALNPPVVALVNPPNPTQPQSLQNPHDRAHPQLAEALGELLPRCRALEDLRLRWAAAGGWTKNEGMTNNHLIAIAAAAPQLTALDLSGHAAISYRGLKALAGCSRLERVSAAAATLH